MLAIEVEYLMGRVFAGHFQDRGVSEWPPHPSRLFSALVGTHFETGPTEQGYAALEWLERQDPPTIRAGEPGVPTPERVVGYVPVNYPGAEPPERRGKQPREFPAQAPSDPIVYFVWPHVQPSDDVLKALDMLAERTGYLGKSCSLVRMRVTDNAPEPTYLPSERGGEVLRVASPGRFQELKKLYEKGLRPSSGLQQPYARVGELENRKLHSGFFGDMIFLRKTGGPGLPIEAAITLTEATRVALLSLAGGHGLIPEMLHGHSQNGHCSIAPLPFVGHKHADGHLVGIAVVMPQSISISERNAVLATCSRLKQIHLPPPLQSWEVELVRERPLARTLWAESWRGPARRWRTVTPILLDKFPKKKGPSVEDLLRLACGRSNLPEPYEIQQNLYSPLSGVPPVPEFRLMRRTKETPHWGVHATLIFREKIKGPVLLGAGRFFGIGLMKPDEDGQGVGYER